MKNQYEIDYQQGYDNANEEWLDRIDKIRAEIEKLPTTTCTETHRIYIDADDFKENVLEIIDKYKAESEPQEKAGNV